MNVKKLIVCVVALIGYMSVSEQFIKYYNGFLNIGAGARGLASAEDGTSGYWNPTGKSKLLNHLNCSLY